MTANNGTPAPSKVRDITPEETDAFQFLLANGGNGTLCVLTARHKASGEDHCLLATAEELPHDAYRIVPIARFIPVQRGEYVNPNDL